MVVPPQVTLPKSNLGFLKGVYHRVGCLKEAISRFACVVYFAEVHVAPGSMRFMTSFGSLGACPVSTKRTADVEQSSDRKTHIRDLRSSTTGQVSVSFLDQRDSLLQGGRAKVRPWMEIGERTRLERSG